MERKPVYVGSPVSGAPYTPGITAGGMVFVSGQIPIHAESREIEREDFENAVRLCLQNVKAVLQAAGSDLEHCVKVVVFLADMNNFARLNKVYSEYFGEIKPARSCVQVARLPLDVDVEIEAVAIIP